MEFVWLNKQGVKCDQGFEVQVLSRSCIEYREGDQVLTVEYEPGMSMGRPCLLISPDSFSRWDNMPLVRSFNQEEKLRVEADFREAMRFQGVEVVCESSDF